MATTEAQVLLKLVVNKDTNKVLFAEAKKDLVDILCSFLTLPLGTIIRLVEYESNKGPVTIGSLNSLYHSVAALDDRNLWRQGYNKEMLLRPRNTAADFCNTLKVNIDDTPPRQTFVSPGSFSESSQNGFVHDVAIFVITDDLILMPKPVDYPRLAILRDLGIKGPFSLKEITVDVTKKKVLDLLKCSLLSKSCLTDLLLENKTLIQRPTFFSGSVENNSEITFPLKLFIRKSDGKVLYGLGPKEIADMLFSFLTFPLGGIVRKLGGNSCVGSIDGLYKSIVDMNDELYFMSRLTKNRLVDPYLLLLMPLIRFESSTTNEGNERMFVVTDDLVVTQSSPTSDSNLISGFDTCSLDLKEKVVSIGLVECLNILKASMTSTSALTTGLAHLLSEFIGCSSHDDASPSHDDASPSHDACLLDGVPSAEEIASSSSSDESDSACSSDGSDSASSFVFI
ncbi:uncharacterized protein LOC128195315 [Vigna angularis]|uniref:uncharacterized protein LOC128195315 n=1 Tax=Phaseolus angularis TaxID=3914 RepID=UPI0022B33E7B|nr:uncharacterized protein LOC128195315 [Vigna angularis]